MSVSNGTTANPTVTISGITGDGTLGISIAPGTSGDSAGNSDTGAGPSSTFNVNNTAPAVATSTGVSDPTNSSPFSVIITFTEGVTGFELGDVTVSNGTASNFAAATPNRVWTVDITPSADGVVTVDVAGDVAQDAAGNGNTLAAQLSITYDGTPPEVTSIVCADAIPTSADSVNFTITFSEDVSGVDTGDFALSTTGTVSGNIASVSASAVATVTVDSITGDGTMRLDLIDDDSINDAAGNPLGGSGENDYTTGEAYTIDNTSLSVASLSPADDATGVPVHANLVMAFSEAVTVQTGDITIKRTGDNSTVEAIGVTSIAQLSTMLGHEPLRVVADAYFAKAPFINWMLGISVHVITRMRTVLK